MPPRSATLRTGGGFILMNKKNPFLTAICNIDLIVAGIVLAILIALTVAGVVWRYIFAHPFTWLEEVQVACMVWIVFAGGGAAFRTGNHVAIEMIVDMLPPKLQKVINWLIMVVVVVVLAYLFVQSIGYVKMFIRSGRATPMLKIPYALIYGIVPVSLIIMIVSYLYSIYTGVKSEAKEAAEL